MAFIQINKRILDFDEFKKEQKLVISDLDMYVTDLFKAFSFNKTKEFLFESENLNLKARIIFSKLESELFI